MERDTIFYMLDADDPERREFIAGVVVGGGKDDLVIEFARRLDVAVDDEILLHFKRKRQFLRRKFRIRRVTDDDERMRLKLQPLGDKPSSGEMRGSERIPTLSEPMLARLGDEDDCVVLDIGMSGVAVMASQVYKSGDVLEFEMWGKDGQHLGRVTVRSSIEVRRGRYRYGLKCTEDAPGHNLRTSLPQLWVAQQIKYLELITA